MSSERHILSKSTYMMGLQCSKRLWLYKNRSDLKKDNSQSQQMVFEKGIEVGVLARNLFPNGKDATPVDHFHFQDAVRETKKLINGGAEIIYEAAFQYDGVLAVLDILVRRNNQWFAYEVKSSTEIKGYFLDDAALQYHVITNSGLDIEDIFIVHINTEYNRLGNIDLTQVFKIASVKNEVLALQNGIPANIQRFKQSIALPQEPQMDIGAHCHDPYECNFSDHCWNHIPSVSIFDLTRLRMDKKFELYSNGIVKLQEIPNVYPLTPAQQLQVKGYIESFSHIDTPKIRKWLTSLKYPLYFMDFETFMPPIPLYDNSHPYQQIPFQFSVHKLIERNAELLHTEYLGFPEWDPRYDFLNQLLTAVAGEGSIIVYNKSFEASRLKELKEIFPKFTQHIDRILNRLVDLMEPFRQKWYYAPAMNGSYSIKQVLPALMPEMTYDGLEIGEGGAAMAAFEGLLKIKEIEAKEKIRRALLEYCKLDTLAMTKILNVLYVV